MLAITARDVQFRWRRSLVGVLVTALVFGIALVFGGVNRAIRNEATRIVDLFGADEWVVAKGATGPFTSTAVIASDAAGEIATSPGVDAADPMVVSRTLVRQDPDLDVNMLGVVPGGLGSPPVSEGRTLEGPGEAVVGAGIDADVGDTIELPGKTLRVVGTSGGLRFFFATPTVIMPLADAQDLVFRGQPLAMAFAVSGHAESLPDGFVVRSSDEAVTDLRRPVKSGTQTIEFVSFLLWLITTGIIGSIIYLAALERARDFAVLGAIGVPTRQIVGSLVIESLLLTVIAATLAIPTAYLVSLGLPFPAEIAARLVVELFVVAGVVGLLASLAGVRRAVTTDPALAFGGA